MSHHPTQCQDCRAYINRERYAPFCERGTYYGGIGCIKLSRPAPEQDHTGDIPPAPKRPSKPGKQKGKRS